MASTNADMDTDVEQRIGSSDSLTLFRDLVGVYDVGDNDKQNKKRKARNVGLYRRIVTEERKVRIQHVTLELAINACLLLQVVFAAILTSLAASSSSHIVITIFGALNTVIAAFLSFTKGQGLPQRLRVYQSNLRKVREHIELRERQFSQAKCTLEVNKEVGIIVAMYEKVRKDHEDNHPDNCVPSGASAKASSNSDRKLSSNSLTPTQDTRETPQAGLERAQMRF